MLSIKGSLSTPDKLNASQNISATCSAYKQNRDARLGFSKDVICADVRINVQEHNS